MNIMLIESCILCLGKFSQKEVGDAKILEEKIPSLFTGWEVECLKNDSDF